MVNATPDTLHRLMKHAMDSGRARTAEEAAALLGGYRLRVIFEAPLDPFAQAALLTCVTLASRVFLGGVSVEGKLDVQQLTPLPLPTVLRDAVHELGAVSGPVGIDMPTITIGGDGAGGRVSRFHVRTAVGGWRGGVLPIDADIQIAPGEAMPLAAMLAGAIAVSEAFEFVATGNGMAGRVPVGLSLWQPGADWLADQAEPRLQYLPTRLWLIGLGHLGQAYLWALGLLPYADSAALELALQDDDENYGLDAEHFYPQHSRNGGRAKDSGNVGLGGAARVSHPHARATV